MSLPFRALADQQPDLKIPQLVTYLKEYLLLSGSYPPTIDWMTDYSQRNESIANHNSATGFSHVAVYVRNDNNEKGLIDIGIQRLNGVRQQVGWAKPACEPDESWKIAQTISEVIELLYLKHQLPLVVDFAKALPGALSDMRGRPIYLGYTDNHLEVKMSGVVIADYTIPYARAPAKAAIDDHLHDWGVLARHLGMSTVVACTKAS